MRKWLAALPVLIAAIAAYAAYYFFYDFPERRLNLAGAASYSYVVEPGDTLNRVLADLHADDVVAFPRAVSVYARLQNQAGIKPGEYIFQRQDTLLDLLITLNQGKINYRSITLIEGWSLAQIQAHLQSLFGATAVAEPADLGVRQRSLEGWVFPDTYFYSVNDSPLAIVTQAVRKMQQELSQQWQLRDADLPYENPYDMLIMASLIEKETGADHERELIASVFINRLRKNMKLQTDPTVIYAMGERYDGNIRRKDLRLDSPFNTYKYKGLPPTPIAMPGLRSLQAAAKPATSAYLYFVAKGNGEHYFSTSLEEHNQAVNRFQRFARVQDYRSSPPPQSDSE